MKVPDCGAVHRYAILRIDTMGGWKAGTVRGGRYLVAIAAAGMLAAGCGTTRAPADPLTAAVNKTATQTVRIAVTLTIQSQGMSMTYDVTGAFDFAHARGMLSIAAPVGVTALFIAPKVYIKLSGGIVATLPHGKSWLEIDTSGSHGGATDTSGVGANLADLLASLKDIAGSDRQLGTGTVRGVPVTEYQVDIDPAKVAAKFPSQERASLRQSLQSLGKGTIPVDVWVDAQNLVRQVRLSVHLPGGSSALDIPGNPQLTATADFYDYGVPVQVSAPPAAQVASSSQVISSGIASGSGIVSATGGPATPLPAVSGSLTPAQAAAAGQAVAAFLAALGRNDPAAVARTVLPAQRSCVTSVLAAGAPKFTVGSVHIVSAQPAGNGKATVRFTVNAKASLGGNDIPVFLPGSGGAQWLVAVRSAGQWYVDFNNGSDVILAGACP